MSGQPWWGEELLNHVNDDTPWAHGTGTVTFGRMRAEIRWLSHIYRQHGIGVRDTVALHGTPSFTQLWSVFALWSLGAQVIMLPQRADPAAALAEARPRFHVSFGGSDRQRRPFTDECEVLVRRRPDGRPAVTDHCLVQQSSGTTGQGKLIGRTPESVLAEVARMSAVDGLPAPGERVLLLDSTAHSFGLIGGVLHAMHRGATLVFATALHPARLSAAAGDAQVVIGAPLHFDLLGTAVDSPPLVRLRAAISGGEVLHPEVFERFHRRHGVRIGQVYGTTETGLIAADPLGTHGPLSVGVPVPGLPVRVRRGVLQVHLAQSPYLADPEPWLGGWVSTQDLVTVHPTTGALRLRGRVDSGGDHHADVDLLEIERVLHAHRHVHEAVVLCTDPIEAHVVGSPALAQLDLVAWCRGVLGDTRAPARCHVVPALPRTVNGKYLRNRELIRTARATPS